VLGIADKLTGGAASKVAGMAQKVLGKAAGLLAFVVNTAKGLASRAISTAKGWATKALNAAKNVGKKAFETAKTAATKAFETAKSWGSKALSKAKSAATKAFSTAKSWGSKAISTAKSWGSKAWGTAKSWGSKAVSTAKSLGSKTWGVAKAVGNKVGGFARGVGRTATKVAKAVGLDKAYNAAKSTGTKALGIAKSAAAGLAKRFGPVIDVAKKGGELLANAAPAILSAPAFIGCKILGCAVPQATKKGGQTTKEATDFTTDVMPGVSTVKDTCRCLTGENVVTGEAEGAGGRIMGCIWAAVDVASVIVGLVTFGGGTAAIQAIKTAAKTGLKAMVKTLGKISFRKLVDLAIDLLRGGWKKITGKAAKEAAEKAAKEAAEKAAKEAAEKAAKEAAEKELKKKIAECEALHAAYKALEPCRKCTRNDTSEERAVKIACISAVVAGRNKYLAEKCDYVLPGSIARGSARAEQGHRNQVAQYLAMLAKCSTLPTR
jgi:hypothetical protein